MSSKAYTLDGTQAGTDTFSLCSHFNYHKLLERILKKTLLCSSPRQQNTTL